MTLLWLYYGVIRASVEEVWGWVIVRNQAEHTNGYENSHTVNVIFFKETHWGFSLTLPENWHTDDTDLGDFFSIGFGFSASQNRFHCVFFRRVSRPGDASYYLISFLIDGKSAVRDLPRKIESPLDKIMREKEEKSQNGTK